MKCPLLQDREVLPEDDNQNERILVEAQDCLKHDCAWFSPKYGGCAVWVIATALEEAKHEAR